MIYYTYGTAHNSYSCSETHVVNGVDSEYHPKYKEQKQDHKHLIEAT